MYLIYHICGNDEDLLQTNITVLIVLKTSGPSCASNSTLTVEASNRFCQRSTLTKLALHHSSSIMSLLFPKESPAAAAPSCSTLPSQIFLFGVELLSNGGARGHKVNTFLLLFITFYTLCSQYSLYFLSIYTSNLFILSILSSLKKFY